MGTGAHGGAERFDCEVDEVLEPCERCGRETVHTVGLAMGTVGEPADGRDRYSREPRRISRCVECGATTEEWPTRR
ncbi:MAG: hypothetical protein ABEI39_03040 [Halobacteriales archaeon]